MDGIHSYLTGIRETAILARELLAQEGSFFLQMGPANLHRCALILDEVFGAENRMETITFRKSGGTSAKGLPGGSDYLLWYARDREMATRKYTQLYLPYTRREVRDAMSSYVMVEEADGTCRKLTKEEQTDNSKNLDSLPEGARLYRRMRLLSPKWSETRSYEYEFDGRRFPCSANEQYRISREGMERLEALGRLDAGTEGSNSLLGWKRYEDETPGERVNNFWKDTGAPTDMHYVVETAEQVVERCMLMATEPGDLVLDTTCGSGTTAYVAEKWGRRWITTDTSPVALALARQRLACAIFDYHLLQDSPEGAAVEAALRRTGHSGEVFVRHVRQWCREAQCDRQKRPTTPSPAKGFVYERVPTVSAGILGYGKEAPPTLLVNRPVCKEHGKESRVSGPFTMESHSPYLVRSPTQTLEADSGERDGNVVEALQKTGIGSGANRISVEFLEPWAKNDEQWASHRGRTSLGDTLCRIGRDDETIGPQVVNQVVEEAVLLPRVEAVVIVGYAFAPDVRRGEEKRGRLTIVKAQANQDLRIGGLESTQKDSAFRLVGEPCVQVHSEADGKVSVEVKGFDTYDPGSGQLKGGEAKDIHCWMLDTEYDGESFFARRMHFPNGAGDNQVGALVGLTKKHVDRTEWKAMLSTRSAPVKRPESKRMAVRIVTATGLEMTCEVMT